MKVVNEENKKLADHYDLVRGVVYTNDKYVEYGYFSPSPDNIIIITNEDGDRSTAINKDVIPNYVFSNLQGCYMDPSLVTKADLHIKGNGDFPYTITRHYEAAKSLNIFKDKQSISKVVKYGIAKELKYTFGLEFETSQGYIPQDICLSKGLIPLRDGSITGIEYSTTVLQGNLGLNLLREQIEALKKYTEFNKECALHIHFGGFPVKEKYLLCLAELWRVVENRLERSNIVPPFTFRTSAYKQNGKDYCKYTPAFKDFEDMYLFYVGRKYLGSLYQPHPNDVARVAKWNIKTRYFGLNFINMLCYEGPKTLEFRFLRPTYNFDKIIFWILFINGILKYAELIAPNYKTGCFSNMSIVNMLRKVYPKDIVDNINETLNVLSIVVKNQVNNHDYCGENIYIEEKILNEVGGLF